MEDELLDYVENELPDISTDRKGPSLLCTKLATKVDNLWQNPSSKTDVQGLCGPSHHVSMHLFWD